MNEPDVFPDRDDPAASEVTGTCADHEWIDVSSFADAQRRFLCAGCGMPGITNPRVRRIGDEFADPSFSP